MLINFFHGLRDAGVPVTTRELLDLMEGMKRHIVFGSMDEFYYFSRTCMVKDEKYFDRFDRVFGAYYKGVEDIATALFGEEIPDEWLAKQAELLLSDEDKADLLEYLKLL